ncbi:LysR family transcriptional regulator [Piscinibacter terrae]|uniref:LysR family transcriptional regulator n=1 Tax=Piscinibacter terrae TaxID=2496871 RepID=A0A3N7J5X1_9BURK|nr:LysR family transcriptional regulator [Albitalea terrae]RQP26212.1 LysR family transcriptional regulator [Albitalea terrae]
MDDLRRMAVYATVVEQRSMSGAARLLGMSTSAVSQQIRQLERDNGVTLMHRSTRKLTLTPAGEQFYEGCAAMLAAAKRAQQQLAHSRDAPSGELRLSAPVGFARHIAPALGHTLAEHPGLTLTLLVDDARIDLIEARIDLAIRFGRLPDSNWVARRLCGFEIMLCASPAFLAAQAPITRPEDLHSRQWLSFARPGQGLSMQLSGPERESRAFRVEARIQSNNQFSLQQMCVAGLGLAMMARVDVADDLAAGRLQAVLPQWQIEPLDVWAVTPQRDAQPAKVRVAIEALDQYLSAVPGARR